VHIRDLSSLDLEKNSDNKEKVCDEQYTFEKVVAILRKIFDKF
jgi:hypothetical protein